MYILLEGALEILVKDGRRQRPKAFSVASAQVWRPIMGRLKPIMRDRFGSLGKEFYADLVICHRSETGILEWIWHSETIFILFALIAVIRGGGGGGLGTVT